MNQSRLQAVWKQMFVPRKFCSCRVITRHQYNLGLVSGGRREQVMGQGKCGIRYLRSQSYHWHHTTEDLKTTSQCALDHSFHLYLVSDRGWQSPERASPSLVARSSFRTSWAGSCSWTIWPTEKWGWNRVNKHLWSFFISFCLTEFHSLQLQFPSSGERRQSAKTIPPPRAEC